MEGNEVDLLPNLPSDEEEKPKSDTPIADMLDKLCPYYMALGVTYDEFWNGDYTHLKYYIEKNKLENGKRNHELWLQGLYNYIAFTTALENAFSKKGSAPKRYIEKPLRITPLSEEEKRKEMIDDFRSQLMALDRKFTKKHSTDE